VVALSVLSNDHIFFDEVCHGPHVEMAAFNAMRANAEISNKLLVWNYFADLDPVRTLALLDRN
jgi:hypothetical protein